MDSIHFDLTVRVKYLGKGLEAGKWELVFGHPLGSNIYNAKAGNNPKLGSRKRKQGLR